MPTPEVSVVLGVRNGGQRIAAAVDGILAQRDVDLELIVVDDGSTDSTPATLASFAVGDARLRVVRQEPGGLTAALIRGCAEARAPFIARHDADEVSLPDRLRRQLDAFTAHRGVVLVSCWTAYRGPAGELLRVERGKGPPEVPVPLFARAPSGDVEVTAGPTAHGSTVFPAELYRRVGGYRMAFRVGQDWDLWLRLAHHGDFLLLGETLLSTTVDARSLSFAVRDLQLAVGEASTDALRRRLDGEPEEPALQHARELCSQLQETGRRNRRRSEALGLYHIGEALLRRRHRSALSYLLRSLRRDPLLLRAWVRAGQAALQPRRGAVESST